MLDRRSLQLPAMQPALVRALMATGTPIVLVTMSGSPLALNEWLLAPSVLAILQLWYPGEEGGHGLTDLLFGAESPSGKLPVTFPFDESQIPFDGDYRMTAAPGRSYRYTTVVPLFAFGYGLSYTSFEYALPNASAALLTPAHLSPNPSADAAVTVRFHLANTGAYAGAEAVELYSTYVPLTPPTAVQSIPRTELKAFDRVSLRSGESRTVDLRLPLAALALVGADGKMAVQTGIYFIHVGGAAPGSRGAYVDGDDQHARTLRERMPAGLAEVGACQEAQAWWEQRGSGEDGVASVPVDVSIAGGLVGVLTIC